MTKTSAILPTRGLRLLPRDRGILASFPLAAAFMDTPAVRFNTFKNFCSSSKHLLKNKLNL